jgi:hypothetical protein
MDNFVWQAVTVVVFIFLLFTLVTIVMTLLLVYDVRKNDCDVNNPTLTFVEVANYIYVGIVIISIISVIASSPYMIRYIRNSKISINDSGLRSAPSETIKQKEKINVTENASILPTEISTTTTTTKTVSDKSVAKKPHHRR